MRYVLGVDIGTQGIKGVLLDEAFHVAAKAYREHDYIQPRPNWFEHDAEKTWWGGFKEIVRQLLKQAPISPGEVIGVGHSAIAPCMLPVDEDGRPLRNAILYGVDTRSKKEVREIAQLLGEERIRETSKKPFGTDHVPPKILWYKRNEPDLFSKTKRIFTASNYITYKLTGRFLLDYTQAAGFAPVYDFGKKQWSGETCELLGFSPDLLPELKQCYDIAGTVTPRASAETGLVEGTPVVVGSGDWAAELISAGGFGPGEATLVYGTTGIVSMATDRAPSVKGLSFTPHPILENRFFANGGTSTLGALTKWFRDNFGELEKIMQDRAGINAYTLLSCQAEQVPAGSEGLVILPYFSGERSPIFDPMAKGVVLGLTLHHKRAHLYRALLEGTAYSLRHIIEAFHEAGFDVSRVIACGGGANSSLWVQIVGDVIGFDQSIPNIPNGSDIGSAYLAAKGTGRIEDLASFIPRRRQKDARTVGFDPQNHARYTDYYRIYRRLYESVKSDMHALAELAEGKIRLGEAER
jgi:xylulokinase